MKQEADFSSYSPDLDTLHRYFTTPGQKGDQIPDQPDIDQKLFQEMGLYLTKYFDQKKWRVPKERVSDFYWIVTHYLKATQSLHKGLDNIAGMNLSEFKGKMEVLEVLEYARENRRKLSFKITVKAGTGKSVTITPPGIIINSIIRYFREFQNGLDNEAKEKASRNTEREITRSRAKLIESLETKPDFVSEARKRHCQQIYDYLSDSMVDIPTKGQKYLIIGLLFSFAGHPFSKREGGKRVPMSHYQEDNFDVDNVIDTVRHSL